MIFLISVGVGGGAYNWGTVPIEEDGILVNDL